MTTEIIRAVCSTTKWNTLTVNEKARYDDTYYETLALWETAFGDAGVGGDGDLVTADHIAVAELFAGETYTINGLFIEGWTHDADRNCLIRAASGEEFDPNTMLGAEIAGTGLYFFVIRASHWLTIEDIGITSESSNSFVFSDIHYLRINRCVLYDIKTLKAGVNKLTIDNSLYIPGTNNVYGLIDVILNNSVVIQKLGLGAHDGDICFQNCICNNVVAYNENTKSVYSSFHNCTGDYNAQNNNGSALPPGSNSFGGVIPSDFVDYANGDYHLSQTSKLVGKGTNLSSEFTRDTDGNTIFNWSIGFDDGPRQNTGRGRFVPGKGYVKGFVTDTIPAIGFTTSRAPIINPDARPVIGFGYTESTAETQLIGSGYSLIEVTTVKYAIRTQVGWDSMTAEAQAEYTGWFDTLSAWEAIIPDDLVVLNERWVAECYNDWPSGLDDSIDEPKRITDSTRNIKLTVAIGERHTGKPSTGFYILQNHAWGSILEFESDYTEIEYFNIENIAFNDSTCVVLTKYIKLSNTVLKSGKNCLNIDDYCTVYNVLVIANNIGIKGAYRCYSSSIDSCTLIGDGSSTGISVENHSGELILRNNVSYNNSIDFLATGSPFHTDSSNNATSLSTLDPNLGTIVDVDSSDFTNTASDDYSVADGSALIDAGTDLSPEFTTDIVGTERG